MSSDLTLDCMFDTKPGCTCSHCQATRRIEALEGEVAAYSKLSEKEAAFGLSQMKRAKAAEARAERLRVVLTRCRTVLGNMALENEGAVFNRWPISHEPLRADARHLLPVIDEAIEDDKQ